MASTKEYLDFIMEQLSELDEVSFRAMMGEYILYYRGKVFGGIYDDRLLVKPVPSAVKMVPDATMELPYDGATVHLHAPPRLPFYTGIPRGHESSERISFRMRLTCPSAVSGTRRIKAM